MHRGHVLKGFIIVDVQVWWRCGVRCRDWELVVVDIVTVTLVEIAVVRWQLGGVWPQPDHQE